MQESILTGISIISLSTITINLSLKPIQLHSLFYSDKSGISFFLPLMNEI